MDNGWGQGLSAVDRRAFLFATAAGVAGLPRFAHAAPARKVLVGVAEEDPATINSAVTTRVSSFLTSAPVYSALTHIPQEGKLVPELAEKWEVSPDGKTYIFYLRRDVAWHDGHQFTSADVKFTIENVTSKYHPWGKISYKALDRVETPDPYTAIYHLKHPSASLLLSTDFAVGCILPKHLWEGTDILKNPLNQKPVGTGPYKLVEYSRGRQLRYERNDAFYIKNASQFDEILLRVIPDASARLAAFEQGEVDMLYWNALPQAETPRLQQLANVVVTKSPNRGTAYIATLNNRRPELSNGAVRRAMFQAIDRKFMRENVDSGTTSEPVVGPLWPTSNLYNRSLVDYEFNPAQANEQLDKAGYPKKSDGIRFALDIIWPAYDLSGAKIADILNRNFAAVGIKSNLLPLDRAAMNQRAYVGNDFGITIEAFLLGPDPDIGVERLYNSHNITNTPYANNSGYSNPEVDRLFDEQRVQVSTDKRKEIYDRIQQILWHDLPVFSLFADAPNNVNNTSRVIGIFNETNGAYETFVNAKPPAASAAPASSGGIGKGAAAGVAVVAVAAAALAWRKSRTSRADDV